MAAVWISAAGLFGATIIGTLLGFFVKKLPHKWNDAVLGLSAGVMLGSAILGLIIPGAEAAGRDLWWLIALSITAGAVLLNLLDLLTPHLHNITGLEQEAHMHNAAINKVMLFVMAIAIHKLPEGIATGVGFNAESLANAWTVTLGISIQNIPEGMVIITPLLLAGVSKSRTFLIATGIAVIEVIGVWIGYGLGALSAYFLPSLLALAGGAMLYVVSDEMIPETHSHGHQKLATYSLMIGFMIILFIENIFN